MKSEPRDFLVSSMDHIFSDKAHEEASLILVANDDATKHIGAWVVPSTGKLLCVAQGAAQWISGIGHGNFIIKCYQ